MLQFLCERILRNGLNAHFVTSSNDTLDLNGTFKWLRLVQ